MWHDRTVLSSTSLFSTIYRVWVTNPPQWLPSSSPVLGQPREKNTAAIKDKLPYCVAWPTLASSAAPHSLHKESHFCRAISTEPWPPSSTAPLLKKSHKISIISVTYCLLQAWLFCFHVCSTLFLYCSRGRHCLHIRLCTRWHSPATGMLFFFPGGIIIYSSRFILLGVSPSCYTGPAVFALSLQLWSRFINTTLRHTKRCNMDAHVCSYSDMNYFPSWRRMWGGVVLFVFPDQLATKRSWSVVIDGF